VLLSTVLLAVAASVAAQARSFKVLYAFKGGKDGEGPMGTLIRDSYGNIYGTTQFGGSRGSRQCRYAGTGCGTIFKLDPVGHETLLHSFSGLVDDGKYPFAGLVQDQRGMLYGTTMYGGWANVGTVFKLNPLTDQYLTVHSFSSTQEGQWPSGGVIVDAAGHLYGTTQGGGDDGCWGGCGLVFGIDQDGNEAVLLTFSPPAESPTASLIMGKDGTLYGTTAGSGYSGALGTIFEVNRAAAASSLYSFRGGTNGEDPWGSLVQDKHGNLYGTTYAGGDFNCNLSRDQGCGVVFKVNAGRESVLHAFHGPDGAFPTAAPIRDKRGNLYGTTTWGGSMHYGTVFKLDKNGKITILHSFDGLDGMYPFGGLTIDAVGNLYGTTEYGGDFGCIYNGCGVVFEIMP